MKSQLMVLAGFCIFSVFTEAHAQTPLGTEFTYQGQLKNSGAPLNATADFEFRLFNDPSAGIQVGSTNPVNNVTVVDGLFTATLNFGSGPFIGDKRWLDVRVRSPAGSGNFTTLSPRQPLTATPFALYALSGPGSGGPWAVSGNNVVNTNTGNVGIGTSAPAGKLDIQGSNSSNVLFGRRTGGGLAHNLYIDGAGNGSMQLIDSAGTPRVEMANGLIYFTYGNVGIGTTVPAAKLDVRGEIRMGNNGQFLVAGGDENLRIIRGVVNFSNGTSSGQGFSVERLNVGTYFITFNTPFASNPSVTVTVDDEIDSFPVVCVAAVFQVNGGLSVKIRTRNLQGNPVDKKFHFIAVGLR